jgi:hypothetical protein
MFTLLCKILSLNYALAMMVNPILSNIPAAANFSSSTTLSQIMQNKSLEVIQLKLSPESNRPSGNTSTLTVLCKENSQKNIFLNLEFKNDKLDVVNVVYPLSENSINNLIDTNKDGQEITKDFGEKIERDLKHFTLYNAKNANVNYLKTKHLVLASADFKGLDHFLLERLSKKSLPFTEKGRQDFFSGHSQNVVWQWFDMKSLTKGFVSYNAEENLDFAIVSIETKTFNQDSFL